MDPNYYSMMYGSPYSSGNELSGYGGGASQLPGMMGGNYEGSNSGFNSGMGMGMGAIGSGLMGLMGMGGGQNPMSAAAPYLNQIQNVNQQYMNPFVNMGEQSGNQLSGILGNMMKNPGQFVNQLGSNFHSSPGYNFAVNQAMQGGNRGMAAGGLAGSPSNQMQNMGTAENLANQNYYQYLGNAENMFGQGLQGLQGLTGIGLQAGTNAADNISQMYSQLGSGAYNNAMNQNAAKGNEWSNIFSGLGSLAGAGAFGHL